MKYVALLLSFLVFPVIPSFTKDIKNACSIITAEQLYKVIGYQVQMVPGTKGKRCEYKTENGFVKISVEYTAYKDAETAFKALRKQHADNLEIVKKGEKVENEYNVLGTIPEGKPDDYYMTGNGNIAEGPNTVSYRFMLNRYIVSFNTRGIMKTIVVPKLGAVYNTILRNAGWKF